MFFYADSDADKQFNDYYVHIHSFKLINIELLIPLST